MTVERHVKVTLEGDEVVTLKDLCEMARRYFDAHRRITPTATGGTLEVAEFEDQQCRRVRDLMSDIFAL